MPRMAEKETLGITRIFSILIWVLVSEVCTDVNRF